MLCCNTYYESGSFRVLQRYALRASTAAPTVFKPVMMGNEMYCDGGIVASNPTAVAVHEARSIFPDVPIELIVSLGTGGMFARLFLSLIDGALNSSCTRDKSSSLVFTNTTFFQAFWKRKVRHE